MKPTLAILAVAASLSTSAFAGVYRGPGQYVAVYSSYVIGGNGQDGYQSKTYHGPIEGPFATRQACEARVAELREQQKARNILDGTALFMCYALDAPMAADSGVWWEPRRNQ
ncbi:MAG: hypothetical protein KA085_19330 [Phenylobacterium sp.]|uniref:hypothetical protein n=1 Tax=Phenylobacterium sp. TaxID=1871053 RepID=UPI001B6C15B7|nr:hypothetical protein [Phenylobacterium sp.]MBP6546295.1 hypothetical protein [Phenylobacterium sp.]MBP7651648.1 hypothetical protein [Phenylobacterium sp.]MBP7818275.1 hypothetical protein [Phenylobacterium sp.]MBP8247186.1 hypothetical protein [Phenylobacterium sp.]